MKKFESNSNYPYHDYYEKFNLNQTTISFVLNKPNLKNILCSSLNYEQILLTEDNILRDYRGLAELLNLSYNEIQNLSKNNNPTASILNQLDLKNQTKPNVNMSYTLFTIVDLLEKMQRFDIIDDVLIELQSLNEHNLSKNEKENLDILRINGFNILPKNTYNAYVCYADNDLPFVHRLSEILESSSINLKLFIRDRDLLMGTLEYHEFITLMEKQCNRLLIILSPDFLNSPECDFQTKFTLSLQIQERQRKLIPILYKACELPLILRFMTKIDLTKNDFFPEWTLRKLVMSLIDDKENLNFIQNIKKNNSTIKELDSGFISNNSITTQSTCVQLNEEQNNQVKPQLEAYSDSKCCTPTRSMSIQTTSFQTFQEEETCVLLEKQKNFKILNKILKKIGILNKR